MEYDSDINSKTWGFCKSFVEETIEYGPFTLHIACDYEVHHFSDRLEIVDVSDLDICLLANDLVLSLDLKKIQKEEKDFYARLIAESDKLILANCKRSLKWCYSPIEEEYEE